jgi:hypothetical protein
MPNTTLGYPYVTGATSPAGHTQVQALAEAVDASPGISSLTSTEIGNLTAGEKRAGRVVYNETTGKLQRSNGSTWTDITTSGDLSGYATTTNLSDHASDSTSVHGIADTSQLATLSDVYARDEAGHLIATSVFT